jgi:hypothetical protein
MCPKGVDGIKILTAIAVEDGLDNAYVEMSQLVSSSRL